MGVAIPFRTDCPVCKEEIEIASKDKKGTQTTCPSCRASLEVTSLDPLVLRLAYDDPEMEKNSGKLIERYGTIGGDLICGADAKEVHTWGCNQYQGDAQMRKPAFYLSDPEDAVRQLRSNAATGLDTREAQERLARYGPNTLQKGEEPKVLQLIRSQLKNPFVIVLLAVVALFYIVEKPPRGEGEYAGAILIVITVLFPVIVGLIQAYRLEKAVKAVRKFAVPTAHVLRDGHEVITPTNEVVPGDVILLDKGDRVPADALLLEVTNLKTAEVLLTGESTPVDKTVGALGEETPVVYRKNVLFMGTHVFCGHGKAIVTSTGKNTEFGKNCRYYVSTEY